MKVNPTPIPDPVKAAAPPPRRRSARPLGEAGTAAGAALPDHAARASGSGNGAWREPPEAPDARTVFELAPVPILLTDDDRITTANRACAALFGVADARLLVGRSVFAVLETPSRSALRWHMDRTRATGAPAHLVRERVRGLDRVLRDVDIAMAPLPSVGGSALQMVFTDTTEQSAENDLIERSRRELRRLSATLVTAREDERRRIARELHDELGQWLTALKMELSSLGRPDASATLAQRVVALGEMADETMRSVRRIAMDLRPMMLDDLGLNAAIEWLAGESTRRLGIPIELLLGEADPPVSEAASIALYRITQEALTNIARHAHARRAQIALSHGHGRVYLTVSDDGVGFGPADAVREDAQGLLGIRERAYMFGGTMQVGNRPEGGASVTVALPTARTVHRD